MFDSDVPKKASNKNEQLHFGAAYGRITPLSADFLLTLVSYHLDVNNKRRFQCRVQAADHRCDKGELYESGITTKFLVAATAASCRRCAGECFAL